MCETTDDTDIVLTIGVCAMAKKAMSKPMKEILRRMDKFQHIRQIIFDEHVILNEPIEAWPICDALVSFYSEGFPLEKAIAYSKLRKPYLVNDLESQYILMDRRRVYECLQLEGVPVPRYACVSRRPGSPPVDVVESDDSIEIDGEVFHKPFVEKPLNAEDHNVYIYFPSSAGGGSQRLFRKVGNLSSKYFPYSTIRTNGSYMYEEFMPTDGTDVKVYTVADDYAHAEARKSPALDGKVERDHEGKEVRYPVILTPREKIIAKKVAKAVRQQICGFDLLRANGMSYVCDVNGFSFVKSSRKYYDDCSHILGVLITRKLAPRLCLPAYLPPGTDVDTPLVPTTCGTIMELRCVIAVIRHGDRTPKQKMKMEVRHEKFFSLFTKYAGDWTNELKLKRPTQLQEVLDIVRCILEELDTGQCSDPQLIKNKPKFEQLRYVLEMYGTFSGINRKIQLKYHPQGMPKGSKPEMSELFNSVSSSETPPSLLLVVKWGGELTAAGRQQAETLGRAFRCIYPGGDGHYGKDPGLGLLRLHSTYRHDLKIYASDEGRVQMTAAAFAKGFLALEGELPPILVQMVKSANTNGLLDNDNDCRHYQHMVKRRIRDVMTKTTDFTPDDIAVLVPTGAKSLVNAMLFLGNPRRACDRLYGYMKRLGSRLLMLATSPKDRGSIQLYQGESWELLLRRWGKLLKDFRSMEDEYDLSKISDIYDNIKYDLQHNPGILLESEAHEFFMCAKSLADIVVPQEYGITKEEKLVIGQRICTPLMRKILSDARYTDVDECTRLHAGYSKGVASPERFVRTRLYFTSESHLHSLLTCLRYGELADVTTDEQWRRAMDYVCSISEINYLAQIVIMIYEDPTEEPKTEKRFHVELHFSPGAFSLCHDLPEGIGFRPGKLERLNSQASVVSSATSVGKYSNDSFPHVQRSGGAVGSGYSSSALSAANSTPGTGRPEPPTAVSPRTIRRPVYSASMEQPSTGFTDAMDTPTKASGSRSSLGNLSSFSANLEATSPGAVEMQKVAERLEHVKHWRETAVMNSSEFNTGTTNTTTGSTSDAGEDDEVITSNEDEYCDPSTVRRVQSGHAQIPSTAESTSTPRRTLAPNEQTLTPGLSGTRTSLTHSSPARSQLPPTLESTTCTDACTTLPVIPASLPAASGVGIGRFIITRSVAEPSESRSNMSPAVHAKSVVVLPTDNTLTDDNSGTPGSVSQKTSPFNKSRSHHARSKQLEAHANGRLAVSCSPERYRAISAGVDPSFTTNVPFFTALDPTKLSVSGLPNTSFEPEEHTQLLASRQQLAARSVPLTRWLLEQAELVRTESNSSYSMGKIVENLDSKLLTQGRNLPTDSITGTSQRGKSEPSATSTECNQVRRGKSVSIDVPTRPSEPQTPNSPKDDLISFSLPSALGMKRVVRYHSADSLRSVPMEEFAEKTTSSSRSGATRSPSRTRNPKTIAQEIVGLMPTVNETEANLGSIAYSLSGGGSKYALIPPTSVNPAEPKCDLYLDGAGGLRGKLLRPSTNAMCDAIMAFANLIEQPHDDADDVGATNQALNAMTYPSSQNAYHLDIERLVRETEQACRRYSVICPAVVQAAPVPRPFCRSLISTAVIRGSRDDAQASSSVPDIKRLMDDAMMAPRTLTPGSSNDFLVPSAPCVPEVYPLETLHNALTLSQLEAFFARLTTRKFPTPFTSPQHPSTPVAYYHQYHDSAASLISALQTNTSTTEMLTNEQHQLDDLPADLVSANHYVNTACQAESTVAPTTAVFRLITVHRPSDTTTEGFAGPDSDTATDNVWMDDAKHPDGSGINQSTKKDQFTEPDRTEGFDSGASEHSA